MIYIRFIQNFGNWLNQYCYGRLLAEETGYNLKFYKATKENPTYRVIRKFFPYFKEIEDGISVEDKFDGIKSDPYDIKVKEMAKLLIDKKEGAILNSTFEFYGFYSEEQKNKVKKYMRCKQNFDRNNLSKNLFQIIENGKLVKKEINFITDNDLVVHLRLGDFIDHQSRLLLFYYFDQIFKMAKYERVFVVSGDMQSPLLKYFHDLFYNNYGFSPIYYNRENNTFINDFNMVRLFNKIAISQSSFTWWAALLSNAQEIYFPLPNRGPWSGDGFKARYVNEDRYIYVKEDEEGTKKTMKDLKIIKKT